MRNLGAPGTYMLIRQGLYLFVDLLLQRGDIGTGERIGLEHIL